MRGRKCLRVTPFGLGGCGWNTTQGCPGLFIFSHPWLSWCGVSFPENRSIGRVTLLCNANSASVAQRCPKVQYLKEGYPIATGVIEGACRHLVKDRMERSGMRWRLSGAAPMLMLRAIHVSNHWDTFQTQRMKSDLQRLHPNRHLIQSYTPEILAI